MPSRLAPQTEREICSWLPHAWGSAPKEKRGQTRLRPVRSAGVHSGKLFAGLIIQYTGNLTKELGRLTVLLRKLHRLLRCERKKASWRLQQERAEGPASETRHHNNWTSTTRASYSPLHPCRRAVSKPAVDMPPHEQECAAICTGANNNISRTAAMLTLIVGLGSLSPARIPI